MFRRCAFALLSSSQGRRGYFFHHANSRTMMKTWLSTTSKPTAPSFDAEVSRVYKIVAENHRHPSGPWNTMLERIHAFCEIHGPEFTVLDLATGPGEPAESIARQFSRATVVGTDISPHQVALAEQTTATLPNMSVQVAYMTDLSDFDDGSFDIVTCCDGFMFPPDISRAIKEAHRVLKPHGRLIATTWNKASMVEGTKKIMSIVQSADDGVNDNKNNTDGMGTATIPPKLSFDPLSLSEPGLFESMLRADGDDGKPLFTKLQVSEYEYPFDLTKDPEVQFKSLSLTIKPFLDEREGAWEKAREAFQSIKSELGGHDDRGHFILEGMEYKVVVATKES